jgi:hypothetical protein
MKRLIIILSLLASSFILIYATEASASCNATRFIIKDEVTGQELGLIYTDSNTSRAEGREVCLEGKFAGVGYQYLYKCTKDRTFVFIKKFKTYQEGCEWGDIH